MLPVGTLLSTFPSSHRFTRVVFLRFDLRSFRFSTDRNVRHPPALLPYRSDCVFDCIHRTQLRSNRASHSKNFEWSVSESLSRIAVLAASVIGILLRILYRCSTRLPVSGNRTWRNGR